MFPNKKNNVVPHRSTACWTTRYSQRGFTLIELLLGLSIFALIAVSVSTTLWGGIRLSHRMDPQNNVYREAQWSMALMAKEFENMVFYDFSNSYPDMSSYSEQDAKVTFLLEGDEGLTVVSYYLAAPEQSRIHKIIIGNVYSKNVAVTIKNTQAVSVNYLMREEVPLAEYLSNNTDHVYPEVISTRIKENGLRFYYQYITNKESNTRSWESSWQDNIIPASVRIEMDILSEDDDGGMLTVSRDILLPIGSYPQQET